MVGRIIFNKMKALTYYLPVLMITLLIGGCEKRGKAISTPSGEEYKSFTADGAWCWFSDPRAVYFKGKYSRSYAGWMDSLGSVVIGYYDHDTKAFDTTIIHHSLEVDDHDNPSLFIDDKGIITVYYSRHARRDPIMMMRSANPEDIKHWETKQTLSLNDSTIFEKSSNTYTYTNILQLSEEQNRQYLFWRGTDFKPVYSVSMDSGKSWAQGKLLVLPDRIYNNRRPYIKISSNDKDAIHFAFTDGHPRDEATNSIYYARYSNGMLMKASREPIMTWDELPLNPEKADIVYDAKLTGEKAWIWDVAENSNGNPVIVYARFPNDSTHVYYYATWNDNKWNNYIITESGGWFPETPAGTIEREPNYSGGIILDHQNPSIVYLSRQVNGVFEIERWSTRNGGGDWTTKAITSNSIHNNIRPFVIRNYAETDSLRVLWMNVDRYVHYTDYQTSIKMNLVE